MLTSLDKPFGQNNKGQDIQNVNNQSALGGGGGEIALPSKPGGFF